MQLPHRVVTDHPRMCNCANAQAYVSTYQMVGVKALLYQQNEVLNKGSSV